MTGRAYFDRAVTDDRRPCVVVVETDRAGRQVLRWVGGIGAQASLELSGELLAWLHEQGAGEPTRRSTPESTPEEGAAGSGPDCSQRKGLEV